MLKKRSLSRGLGRAALPKQDVEPGLGFLLRETYRGFARELDKRLARHCITHAQWVLLWFLQQARTLTPTALSESAGIKKASVTAAIEVLRTSGLISAERDKLDGRKINLRLTPLGHASMKELAECAAAANRRGLRGLDQRSSELLRKLLKRVSINFEKTSDKRIFRSE